MIKMMIVGRRRGGMTVAQLHHYMVEVHGAAVVKRIAEQPELTPRRYVQNHVFDGSTRVPSATPDAFASSRDFITQVWFDDPAQAAASLAAPFYREHLRPDEDRFVDQGSVVRLPVQPHEHFRIEGPLSGSKLFVFHQCAEGVAVDDLAATTLALWEPLLAEPGHGIECLVRNRVRPMPGQPAAADSVDEVWLQNDEAARRLATRWQAMADDARLGPYIAPGSCFMLLAHERVMFAG